MKKIFCIIMLLTALLLTSCSGGDTPPAGDGSGGGSADQPGSGEGSADYVEGDFIYAPGSELYIVRGAYQNISPQTLSELMTAVEASKGEKPALRAESEAPARHEIVLGRASRAVSSKAYRVLHDLYPDSDTAAYVIYSDGSSVAVAYTMEDDKIAIEEVIDLLVEEYLSQSTLTLPKGVICSQTISISDYRQAQDDVMLEQKWNALYSQLESEDGEEIATDIVNALKALYAIYDDSMITWFANLWDPEIGGFYYSNSARDTVGYLPDVESTVQVLGFINASGMADDFGGEYQNALPTSIKEKIASFVQSLQDPDGYFYHPQWGKGISNSRQGRDLGSAKRILRALGADPKYPYPGESAAVTYPLSGSVTVAVSRVTPAASLENAPDRFKSEESYRTYLTTLDIKNKSYSVGNELQASVSQINTYGALLGVDLMQITIDWLNENQNPETGLWHPELGYTATNSLHKIFSFYNSAGKPIPNVEKAIDSAMVSICSDEPLSAGVDIYNAWSVIGYVYTNLRRTGGDNAEQLVSDMITRVRAGAADMILGSLERISVFEKSDGSFSYGPLYSSGTSQGAPAAVPQSVEGDVNGNCIACTALVQHIFSALDLEMVPLYTRADLDVFNDIILNCLPIEKGNELVQETITFDDDERGTHSSSVITYSNSGCENIVIADPREGREGNVFRMSSINGEGDSLRINHNANYVGKNRYVFEADICYTEAANGYLLQFSLGSAFFFYLTLKDGVISISDGSSNYVSTSVNNHYGVSFKVGEWHNIRIEHYIGDASTVRTIFYLDGKPIAVSDNFLGKEKSGAKPSVAFSHVSFYMLSGTEATFLVDDIDLYADNAIYKPIKLEDPNMFNVDKDLVK